MSQNYFNIDPTVTSGTQLASLLNLQQYSLLSTSAGSTRPAQVTQGGLWVNNSSAPTLILNFYDGTNDIAIAEIDAINSTIKFSASEND